MLRLVTLLALLHASKAGITLEFGTKKKPPPNSISGPRADVLRAWRKAIEAPSFRPLLAGNSTPNTSWLTLDAAMDGCVERWWGEGPERPLEWTSLPR